MLIELLLIFHGIIHIFLLPFVISFKNGVTAPGLQMPRRHFILSHDFIQAVLTCFYEVLQVL